VAVGSAMQEFAVFLLGFMILAVSGGFGALPEELTENANTGFQTVVLAAN
jgi:hypothetical protein